MTVHINYQTDGEEVFPMLSFQKDLKKGAFIVALNKRHPMGLLCAYNELTNEETQKLIDYLITTLKD